MKGKLSLLYNIRTRHHQAYANDIWNWKKDEYRKSREKMQPYWWWWFSHSVKINPSLLVPPKLKWKNNILQRLVYATEYSLKIYYYYLSIIFGCTGSSLLHSGFLQLQGWGWLLSSCEARASHCSGFSCCRAHIPGHTDFSNFSTWAQ